MITNLTDGTQAAVPETGRRALGGHPTQVRHSKEYPAPALLIFVFTMQNVYHSASSLPL